jgi:hypothetical protein
VSSRVANGTNELVCREEPELDIRRHESFEQTRHDLRELTSLDRPGHDI